jgi:hypothetical protein
MTKVREFKMGQRVRVNVKGLSGGHEQVGDMSNSLVTQMYKYDGQVFPVVSVSKNAGYRLEGAGTWHWLPTWLQPVDKLDDLLKLAAEVMDKQAQVKGAEVALEQAKNELSALEVELDYLKEELKRAAENL